MMVVVILFFVIASTMIGSVMSDPQINLLNEECSQFKIADTSNFFSNFNATFTDIRRQLSDKNTHFATAYQADVFALVQCRKYLSIADCITCFDSALLRIRRNCPAYDYGAHVIYEGCFLRYEIDNFFSEPAAQDNSGKCSDRTILEATAFNVVVGRLLTDLEVATPKIKGFFAADIREALGGGARETVYAVAQCIETLSQSNCQSCLKVAYGNIQNCPPQSGGTFINVQCFLRYSDTSFFPNNQTTNILPYVHGAYGGGSSSKTTAIASVAAALVVLLLILALLLWYWFLRKPEAKRGVTKLQGPAMYSYKDLKSTTKDFSEEYKIGEGGFGDVYKGTVKNGDIVAVKRLAITTSRARAEVESEVRLIGNVHHRNIIRLLGHSGKGPELLLVFEYMANGSLDNFLYGEKRGTLTWKQRIDIIFGIARGLAYLHEQFHVHIIHRDIKSSNILLDDNFQPKIADFGLARFMPEDQSHISTRFAGTLGYTAPEYAIHGHLSEKVDTYSFGVVVLEITSGRRCNNVNDQPIPESLLEYAWKLYEKDMHLELVDKTIDTNEYKEENAKKIIEIALMCTQSPVSSRPTISEVVVLLMNERSQEHRPPTKPAMIKLDELIADGTSTSIPSEG